MESYLQDESLRFAQGDEIKQGLEIAGGLWSFN